MEFMSGEFLAGLVVVLGVNLILSGDNAVVIAMAARASGPSSSPWPGCG